MWAVLRFLVAWFLISIIAGCLIAIHGVREHGDNGRTPSLGDTMETFGGAIIDAWYRAIDTIRGKKKR